MHRMFSGKKPMSREIPRFFVFDCCAGDNERDTESRYNLEKETNKSPGITIDHAKRTESEDIMRAGSLIWAYNEHNPDYKLVVINAANNGFQSKMRSDTGSYVITQFTQRLEDNIDGNNDKYLNETLDEIQEDLHEKGKQLITKTFNNKTEKIKFLARKEIVFANEDDSIDVELSPINKYTSYTL